MNSNTVESLGLGAPIGTTQTPHSASTRGMDDDEHGAGVGSGVAGGGTRAGNNADVYQSSRGDNFSAGLSGEHTSGGLPTHGQTPIADKFTGHSTSAPGYDGASGAYAGSGTNNGLTGESHADSHFKNTSDLTGSRSGAGAGLAGAGLAGAGASGLSGSAPSQEGVSGQYAGSGTSHGLTGESHAESHGHSGLAAGAGAAGLGAGALGAGAAAHSHSDRDAISRSGETGTHGVGAAQSGFNSTSGNTGSHGLSASGAGAGAAGLGAGALGAGAATHSHSDRDASSRSGETGTHGVGSAQSGFNSTSGNTGSHGLGASGVGAGAAAGAAGAYGASKTHDNENRDRHPDVDQPERGQPISNPEEIDSGTRHGLVWQESTGKYVHRHELEDEGKNAARRS